MRWFEQQRVEWIEETVRIFGFINREHIMKKFGVSTPQASYDLRKFQELHPGLIKYNRATKRYEAARSPFNEEGGDANAKWTEL